jgi:hypothetical protein
VGNASVLGRWTLFLNLNGKHPVFTSNVLPPLEPKLLVIWERIGEALKMVYRAYQFADTWY